MSGFFKDEDIKNKAADEPWKKSERDAVLDAYFAGGNGSHPDTIARKIGRNPKAVRRLLEQFSYNERDRVLCYEPFRRRSRKGHHLTQNERVMMQAHQERGVPVDQTAKLLCRDTAELSSKEMDQAKHARAVAPTIDLFWAHRYIYFAYKAPIISDATYDAMVEEEIEFGGGERAWEAVRSYKGWPDYVKSLAHYLRDKMIFERNKLNE